MTYSLDMPCAYGGPLGRADFRTELPDFMVTETLGFEPDGEGEHQYLQLTKRGTNSEFLAQALAKFAGVKKQDVGFCGLKDRHGIATQWFSVYLPKTTRPDWSALTSATGLDLDIRTVTSGKRKLRRGQHASNHFHIVLRNLIGVDGEALVKRLEKISAEGVPNYFGEQRFGRNGSNLVDAARWLEQGVALNKMGSKSMIMSAARSYLFNLVLAQRVVDGNWQQALPGEITDNPSGPLWGRGRPLVSEVTLSIEEQALAERATWLDGLEHCGLHQERRPLVLQLRHLTWHLTDNQITLDFVLLPGQFATVVLRELLELDNRRV